MKAFKDLSAALSQCFKDNSTSNCDQESNAFTCKVCCNLDLALVILKHGNYAFFCTRYHELKSSASNCRICCVIKKGLSCFVSRRKPEALLTFQVVRNTPPVISYEDKVWVEFYTDFNAPSPWPCFSPGLSLSSSSVARKTQDHMLRWMQACDASHDKCSYQTPDLPTRVIEIGQEDRDVYLLEPGRQKGDYLALSHRWGNQPGRTIPDLAKTTVSTIEQKRNTIPVSELPQTFRDTITVARMLHIPYVWIDSLCIIQDCKDDWAKESSKMNQIYAHAKVTIAADGAKDSHEGLFGPICTARARTHVIKCRSPDGTWDNPVYARKTTLNYPSRDKRILDNFHERSLHYNMLETTLSSRGWTLQEFLLPKRTLHFTTGELMWECDTAYACECRPEPYEINILSKAERAFFVPREKRLLDRWTKLVEFYTQRDLTYDTDRLPALSGIAAVALENAENSYAAGIWKHDLRKIYSYLLWEAVQDKENSKPHRRLETYYAPSWSWASITGPVEFTSAAESWVDDHFLVTEVSAPPATSNPFGQVTEGSYIKVIGLTREATAVYGHKGMEYCATGDRSLFREPGYHCSTFWDKLDVDQMEITDDEVLTLLLILSKGTIQGLILKAKCGNTSIYERVGCFICTSGRAWETWRTPLVRRSIKII